MPYCEKCGNAQLFGSSLVPPSAPTANGPVSGIIGEFDHDDIRQITSLGAEKRTITQAVNDPAHYFDLCLKCGHRGLKWQEKNR